MRVTVQQLQQLHPTLYLAGKRTADVISIRVYSLMRETGGFAVRPSLRLAGDTVEHLCQYCVQHSYPSNMRGIICLPKQLPDIQLEDNFPAMSSAARRSLHARLRKRLREAG